MKFPVSELVMDKDGNIYHLGLKPEHIATKLILVGDQDRVAIVSSFFDQIEHTAQHREFVTHTGTYKGKRLTVMSTGIGTDNVDIVLNELDALVNIDLQTRETKTERTSLELVRIGTCGILQPDIEVHGYLLSRGALGLDNIAHFYEIDFTENEREIGEKIAQHIQLPSEVIPYFVESDNELSARFQTAETSVGYTITSSGFYGPQGRQLNLKTKTTTLNNRITSFDQADYKIINFEMESSALFVLAKALGHKATTICLGVANRPNMKFSKGYDQEMKGLIQFVLDRI